MIISYYVLKYTSGEYLKDGVFALPQKSATLLGAQRFDSLDVARVARIPLAINDPAAYSELPVVVAILPDGSEIPQAE